MQQFFDALLFQNCGAYVLYGSKPLCQFSLRDMDSAAADEAFEKFWKGLSEKEREKITELRRTSQSKKTQADIDKEKDMESCRFRGWLVFQKLRNPFKLKNFVFRVVPMLLPDSYDIFFINIQNTSTILSENYEIFKQAAGIDFDPLQVVFEAEDPNSVFWKNVMAIDNHLAKGLLFGYGLENSLFGNWELSKDNIKLPNATAESLHSSQSHVSTDLIPKGRFSFDIPRFAAVVGDPTPEKYAKERTYITQQYYQKNMLEVTLSQLFQQPE